VRLNTYNIGVCVFAKWFSATELGYNVPQILNYISLLNIFGP